jgi:hypothetical protein
LSRICPADEVAYAFSALRSAPRPVRAGALELLDDDLRGAAKVELIEALEWLALGRPAPT